MDNTKKSIKGVVNGSNNKKISSASEDSLNDFKTPPSLARGSKLSGSNNSGFDRDNSPIVRSIDTTFDNRPDENQPGPSNIKKPIKRAISPSDDSLADFKSPKLESKSTVKILDKPKTKQKKTKRKTKNDSNQMSIESSFFKFTTSFACPLCLKTFVDSVSQISHSKTCASKNNVSTRKLLDAVALQERQAEERRAIGLPAQPFAQPRRKSTFKRSDLRGGDPDVQLALALSESLQEAQNLEELDTAIALAGEQVLITSSQRKSTLKNFGFITNKSVVEVTERPKKKKLNSQTVLQTRSEDTRQRLLAERIAEVIVDNADSTCLGVLSIEDDLGEIKLTSKVLKEILEPKKKLWKGSSEKRRGEFYYVKNLEGLIVPIDPGGVNKNIDPSDYFIESQNQEFIDLEYNQINYLQHSKVKKNDKTLKEMEKALESSQKILQRSQSILESAEKSLVADRSLEKSINLNQKISPQKIQIKNNEYHEKNNPFYRETLKTPDDKKNIEETKGIKWGKSIVENYSLANSWRTMLNSSQCSDVIIFCGGDDKFIYAHSVVFWTRCQLLYRDLISNNDQSNNNIKSFCSIDQLKYQINWTDVDFSTALVFLEFIYCGFIENLNIKVNKLSILVEKYNYYELSEYLKNSTNNIEKSDEISVIIEGEKVSKNFLSLSPINVKSNNNTNITMSPDIFDDIDSITYDNSFKVETKMETLDDNVVNVNSFINDIKEKNETDIDEKNVKTILKRSSTCPDNLKDIEKIKTFTSFSEDLNDTLKKTRSELSVFIEKIQKRNAKDILDDSDDDDDSFFPETKKTNKFKKIDESLSDKYVNLKIDTGNINLRRGSRFWATKKSIEKPDKVEVKKSPLSIFEDEIREKVANERYKFNKLCDNFESDFESDDEEIKNIYNLTQTFDINDPNVSMYTKYKLTHKDNSIAYYRDIIAGCSKESDSDKCFSEKVVSENKQDFTSQRLSVDLNIDKEKQSDVDLEDDLVIELDDKNVKETIFNHKSQLDIEFEDDDFEDDDFNVDKIIEESFCLPKSSVDLEIYSRSFNSSEKVIDVDLDSNDDDDDDNKLIKDFSFTDSQDKDVINKSQSCSKVERSRISITNQLYLKELSRYDLYKSKEQNIDKESVLDLTLSDEEKEDTSLKRQRSFQDLSVVESSDQEILSVKKKKNSISPNLTENDKSSQDIGSQGKTITSNLTNILKECGVISQTPKSPISIASPISLSDDSRESSPVNLSFSEPFEFSQFIFEGGADLEDNFVTSTQAAPSTASSDLRLKRSTTVSPIKNKTRLLMNKSKSTDFSFKSTNQQEITTTTTTINKKQVCNYLKLSEENVIVSMNVEPRVDFNLLSSPELNRKLNLYGLKNQKRHRAIKLLTYIYESLNPLVPEEILHKKQSILNAEEEYKWRIESLLRTDDEEINEENNPRVSSDRNNSESVCSELPEEMDLTDDEYDQKDIKSVKQVFEMLLSEDDDLDRKVLMYESLPLETLHAKIKDRGIKCSVRVLMDYLNEECISFFIEAPKKWSNGRRKPKKYK